MGLPLALPRTVLNTILHSTEQLCSEAAVNNAKKIARRFGREDNNSSNQVQGERQAVEEEQKNY